MKKNILVSIIIPVYNGANYMTEAIDSALNQTYKNKEIIVVNDGSKDNGETDKIAKSYGDKIRYYKKENGGVSTALNFGISKMKGDYFSWLSHDDLYKENKLEEQIKFIQDNNIEDGIIFSDYYLIDKEGTVIAECIKPHDEIESKPEYALYRGHINGNSLLIPKKAFEDCGTFDTKLRCAQDYLLWYEMMKKYKFYHIPQMLVCSRVHGQQVTETSPLVEEEGNWFWTKIVKELPVARRIELEGSNYKFLSEMARFLKDTPYRKTQEYCESEAKKEYQKIKKALNKIKVSVIIPFYNRVELVQRAINSVLNQTYKNIEIILVNDGSKDSIDPVRKIVDKHDNIILIDNKKNKGAAESRNDGIRKATGEYIAFLDSDDEFVESKIEEQLVETLLANVNFSYTQYTRIDEEGNETILPVEMVSGNPIPKFVYSCGVATPTVMIKRDFLINNDYYFNSKLVIGEDTCYWLSMLKNEKILGIEKTLTIVHTNSTSASSDLDKQILGYKTIITYLLNDDYYKNFDYEISLMMEVYADMCKKKHFPYLEEVVIPVQVVEEIPIITEQTSVVKLKQKSTYIKDRIVVTLSSLRKDGPIITTKKILKRIINKLKRIIKN